MSRRCVVEPAFFSVITTEALVGQGLPAYVGGFTERKCANMLQVVYAKREVKRTVSTSKSLSPIID
ncbi:hypothetical protein MASSI9I_20620 [Massilia sp. 9I]|nr:hypothetical protein MASSI9I_20620 [Massilia sp. 9I]